MSKWWVSAVLLVGWASLVSPVAAQYLPDGRPPAPLADPVPVSTGATNMAPAVPGPMSGYLAPYGPGEDLMLAANHSSAFPIEPRYEQEFCFFHAGALALQRQKLGHGVTAFYDRTNPSRLDTGRDVFYPGFTPAMNLNQLKPEMAVGATATLGYMFGAYSLELTGIWVPESTESLTVQRQGQLHTFFFNAPLGFGGNNNLFRQADVVTQEFTSRIAGGELNLRTFSLAYTSVEVLCGLRYLDYMERLGITVDDDGNTFRDIRSLRNERLVATYTSRTRNRVFGPQLGLECQKSICQGIALGAYAKATAGINISDVDLSLTRGDAVVGLNDTRSEYTFASILDAGLYLDAYWLERFRVRTGYQILGMTGVLEAPDQLNYDLNVVGGTRDVSGAVFYHGFTVQLQFLF